MWQHMQVTYVIHIYVTVQCIYHAMLYIQYLYLLTYKRLYKTTSDRDVCLPKMMVDKIYTKICM